MLLLVSPAAVLCICVCLVVVLLFLNAVLCVYYCTVWLVLVLFKTCLFIRTQAQVHAHTHTSVCLKMVGLFVVLLCFVVSVCFCL